jgi:hypothetical protein
MNIPMKIGKAGKVALVLLSAAGWAIYPAQAAEDIGQSSGSKQEVEKSAGQSKQAAQGAGQSAGSKQIDFERIDQNRDGFISTDEASRVEPTLAEQLSELDRDGDGKLSKDECAAVGSGEKKTQGTTQEGATAQQQGSTEQQEGASEQQEGSGMQQPGPTDQPQGSPEQEEGSHPGVEQKIQ